MSVDESEIYELSDEEFLKYRDSCGKAELSKMDSEDFMKWVKTCRLLQI